MRPVIGQYGLNTWIPPIGVVVIVQFDPRRAGEPQRGVARTLRRFQSDRDKIARLPVEGPQSAVVLNFDRRAEFQRCRRGVGSCQLIEGRLTVPTNLNGIKTVNRNQIIEARCG